ncbi:MAG TPA: response regulator [Nocardioidaceae bacterium]|nr:response regulator [Nocardioidaceae bacterium]
MPTTVLLVDDVVEVRRLLRTALRLRGGFDVAGEASDGAEAVRLAASLQPDIVVLDLGLPDLAGREVLTGIREASPGSDVVVFSGTDPADEEWVQQQVAGYVVKDATVDYLVDLLETVGKAVLAEAELHLPEDLTSAALARRFASTTMSQWELVHLVDDALVIVSELAANAVTHARSASRLRLQLKPSALRIEVADEGTGTPEPQPLSESEEHGRGLFLIGVLSTAWGMESVGRQGKLVWAELAREPEALPSQSRSEESDR